MMGLTPRLAQLKAYIGDYQHERGCSPALSEMASAIGLRSKSGVHRMLKELEERGHVRLSRAPRSVALVRQPREMPTLDALNECAFAELLDLQKRLNQVFKQKLGGRIS